MNFSSGAFDIRIFKNISAIEEPWNAFHSGARHLNSVYLAALESAQPADMEFRYVVVYKGDKIVAAAYLQLINYSVKNFSGEGSFVLVPLLKLFFLIKKIRLLFCGNLFSVDFPCLHFSENDISFEEAISLIQKIADNEKCQLLMMKEMNFPEEKLKILTGKGFREYSEDMSMSLEINTAWKSFGDYNKALSKKYRKRLKQIRNAKEKFTTRMLTNDDLKLFLPDVGRLFSMTASRQFLKMGIIDEHYFSSLQKAYGEVFFINGYFLGDRLIAFASHLDHGDTLEVHYIGIDYTFNKKYSLYFNILYDGLEMAIAKKKKYLELGRTAREAKASMGCTPTPSYDYLFVSNRFIDFLISVFEKIFLKKIGEEWKNRNPFRSAE